MTPPTCDGGNNYRCVYSMVILILYVNMSLLHIFYYALNANKTNKISTNVTSKLQ